jgi:hypothetical protein
MCDERAMLLQQFLDLPLFLCLELGLSENVVQNCINEQLNRGVRLSKLRSQVFFVGLALEL